jgi:hypothetical protein
MGLPDGQKPSWVLPDNNLPIFEIDNAASSVTSFLPEARLVDVVRADLLLDCD